MPLTAEQRSLLMRANRLLGANLVETNLVKIENLEAANERLLEMVAANQPRRSTVLGILVYEMKVLREEDVLQHVIEEHGLGLVDLRVYDMPEDIRKKLDTGASWATWTIPFDHEEDMHFVATSYYLSPSVRAYWEKMLGPNIIWYGASLDVIADILEKIEAERAAAAASAAGAPAPAKA